MLVSCTCLPGCVLALAVNPACPVGRRASWTGTERDVVRWLSMGSRMLPAEHAAQATAIKHERGVKPRPRSTDGA